MPQKPTLNASDLLGREQFADLIGQTDGSEFKAPVVYDEPLEPAEAPEPEKRGVGRPKGSIAVRKSATKNSVMQQRLALEAGIRDFLVGPANRKMLEDAIDRILRVAAYGLEDKDSVAAFRVLSEKLLSSAKQEEDTAQSSAPQVTIVIENATIKAPQPAIEAEFSEVKD